VDFYRLVPKGLVENLRFRCNILRRAAEDLRFRSALIAACRADVLFFFNALCWLYEPRPTKVDGRLLPTKIPFITWRHQDEPIRVMRKTLGWGDVGLEKSRCQGASWIGVLLALHDWLFVDGAKVSIVSSTEKKADDPEDPDSLFWKIDWELKQLPRWLAGLRDMDWRRNVTHHTLVNLRNDGRITAYACTGDIARGGRARWFLMDELSSWDRGPDEEAMRSTQHVTKSRLIVSTPEGNTGAYYRAMHQPSNMIKVVLDWKDNPWHNRGLYRHVDHRPVAVDPVNNPLPPQYAEESADLFSRLRAKGFKLSGELRSPWYDSECDRTNATPQSIAKELDRDYGGSMYRIFTDDFFRQARAGVRPPLMRGMLGYHPETLQPAWDTVERGPCLLWTKLDAQQRPPDHRYVIGADISSGLGGAYSSNSVLAVIDVNTMEQVFEYAANTVQPPDLADLAMALGYWFHRALLIWETNGPGNAFGPRVQAKQYPNLFRRTLIFKRINRRTKEWGWHTDPTNKEAVFSELLRSVQTGELRLRSESLVNECGQYVRRRGRIEPDVDRDLEDESSVGEAHGDRVVAMGLALQGVRVESPHRGVGKTERSAFNGPPPLGTFARRQWEYERAEASEDRVWDGRTNWDMAYGMTA